MVDMVENATELLGMAGDVFLTVYLLGALPTALLLALSVSSRPSVSQAGAEREGERHRETHNFTQLYSLAGCS